jgi:hypothetical protein
MRSFLDCSASIFRCNQAMLNELTNPHEEGNTICQKAETTHIMTQHHTPEDLNPLQHCSQNIKSDTTAHFRATVSH